MLNLFKKKEKEPYRFKNEDNRAGRTVHFRVNGVNRVSPAPYNLIRNIDDGRIVNGTDT